MHEFFAETALKLKVHFLERRAAFCYFVAQTSCFYINLGKAFYPLIWEHFFSQMLLSVGEEKWVNWVNSFCSVLFLCKLAVNGFLIFAQISYLNIYIYGSLYTLLEYFSEILLIGGSIYGWGNKLSIAF